MVDFVKSGKVVRLVAVVLAIAVAFLVLWPFYTVPTGNRGVVTTFGKITGIEDEGLVVLPPWKKLSVFSIRAEQADIEDAEGSTSDTQPVKVSLTVRYSIATDKVAEVYENFAILVKLSKPLEMSAAAGKELQDLSNSGLTIVNLSSVPSNLPAQAASV